MEQSSNYINLPFVQDLMYYYASRGLKTLRSACKRIDLLVKENQLRAANYAFAKFIYKL